MIAAPSATTLRSRSTVRELVPPFHSAAPDFLRNCAADIFLKMPPRLRKPDPYCRARPCLSRSAQVPKLYTDLQRDRTRATAAASEWSYVIGDLFRLLVST